MMGYRTPKHRRIAKEGMILPPMPTPSRAPAGRASLNHRPGGPAATGLPKDGLTGAVAGLKAEDSPSTRGELKRSAYSTARCGKKHRATATSHLPTSRLDEFFGQTGSHLNCRRGDRGGDYQNVKAYRLQEKYGPGRAACYATARAAEDENTAADKEANGTPAMTSSGGAKKFIQAATDADEPSSVWFHHVAPQHGRRQPRAVASTAEGSRVPRRDDRSRQGIGEMTRLPDQLGTPTTLREYSTPNGRT